MKTKAQQPSRPGNYWVNVWNGWDGTNTIHEKASSFEQAASGRENVQSVHDGQGNVWRPPKTVEHDTPAGTDDGTLPTVDVDLSCIGYAFYCFIGLVLSVAIGYGGLYLIGLLVGK